MSTEQGNAFTRARLVLAGFGWRVFLRRYRWQMVALLLFVALVGSLGAVSLLATSNSSPSSAAAVPVHDATLDAVPTNHVTGSGTASVQLRGDAATIALTTTGLLGGSPHLAHIHGLGIGRCPTASYARLHHGHLSISTGDAIHLYGSTLVSFTEWGSTSGSVPTNIDMDRYPASANIRYQRTTTVNRLVIDLIRDGDAVIVVHGIDYNFNHRYDFGALGVSDLDRTLPGEATAPALCGPLRPAPGNRSATAANPTTYVASMKPLTAAPVASPTAVASASATGGGPQPGAFSLLCHIGEPVDTSPQSGTAASSALRVAG